MDIAAHTSPDHDGQKAVSAAAREKLAGAKHILVGAGAGLSTAAGLTYFGERFNTHFKKLH
ncbi:MAG: hypothetical protein IJ113_03295 [Eggerthellaceae bacterium]|nr:hypothetical protein [Eggerthellaceae bacterium]